MLILQLQLQLLGLAYTRMRVSHATKSLQKFELLQVAHTYVEHRGSERRCVRVHACTMTDASL